MVSLEANSVFGGSLFVDSKGQIDLSVSNVVYIVHNIYFCKKRFLHNQNISEWNGYKVSLRIFVEAV